MNYILFFKIPIFLLSPNKKILPFIGVIIFYILPLCVYILFLSSNCKILHIDIISLLSIPTKNITHYHNNFTLYNKIPKGKHYIFFIYIFCMNNYFASMYKWANITYCIYNSFLFFHQWLCILPLYIFLLL